MSAFSVDKLPTSFLNEVASFSTNQIVVRSNIKNMEECNSWVKEYGKLTNTNWNTRTSKPSGSRFICSKKYICHQSAFKKVSPEENKRGFSKNASCLASIYIKVKLGTKGARRHDSFVKKGLVAIIKLIDTHNHSFNTVDALKYLPADDCKEKFLEYFKSGMGVAKACKHHLEVLRSGGKFTEEDLVNPLINPSRRSVRHWYDRWRFQKGSMESSGIASGEEEKKNQRRRRRSRKEEETRDHIPLDTTIRTKENSIDNEPTPSTSTETANDEFILLHEENTRTSTVTAPLEAVEDPLETVEDPQFLSDASLAPSNPVTPVDELSSGTTSKEEEKRKDHILINRTIQIKEEPIDYQPNLYTSTETVKFILLHEENTWTPLVATPPNPLLDPVSTFSVASLASSNDPETSDGELSSGTTSREEEKNDHPIPLEPAIVIKEEPIDYEPTPSTETANDDSILPLKENTWKPPVATPPNPVVDPLPAFSVASLAPSKDSDTSDGELARKKRKIEASTFVQSTNGPDVRQQSPVSNIGATSNPVSLKEHQKDRFDVFGEFVAGELRSLDSDSCAYALKTIGDIVIRAKRASLSKKTQDAKI